MIQPKFQKSVGVAICKPLISLLIMSRIDRHYLTSIRRALDRIEVKGHNASGLRGDEKLMLHCRLDRANGNLRKDMRKEVWVSEQIIEALCTVTKTKFEELEETLEVT